MENARQRRGLGRRKACDFCCRRKMRCDAKKPKCSGCSMRNVACVWTPGLPVGKTQPRSSRQDSAANDDRFMNIEDRLRAIEAHLWRTASTPESGTGGQHMADALNEYSPSPSIIAVVSPDHNNALQGFDSHEVEDFPLPPRHEIEPLISDYFKGFNQALPLFSQESFMEMFQEWYQRPNQRDQASWSAINVVIALSLRYAASEDTISRGDRDSMASTCLSNAQSTIESLVYRHQDLKGLQVLLGLVFLFRGTAHPHPTCVLTATAVKLVHRLRLHRKSDINPRNSAERDRLFWIAYIIDRDISAHTTEPYLLQDHDIDVDVDGCTDSNDTAGYLFAGNEGLGINFLQLRIQLAHTQGKVYELVHSVQASRFFAGRRRGATDRLHRMLEEWYSKIPDHFTFGKAALLERVPRRHCISLHIAYYQCLFSAHRVHAPNMMWVQRLTDFSDGLERDDIDDSEAGPSLLPPYWPTLVEAARSFLALLDLIEVHDSALRWSASCTCQAAVIILAANNLAISKHELHDQIEADAERIENTLKTVEQRLGEFGDGSLRMMFSACFDLSSRAALAVNRFRETSAPRSFWEEDEVGL
ncbi:Fungal-trans domain-containing protein [Fusarium falciforme]|uniref:Fungal-trans domain-containing protein n=1 Tax=Fusarium falciforme TaxID=195108 RepID=UPI0022FFC984|nr:Fungal-trans domain-containing protein [Fusarium falciforme]WAO84715.1 Fungal-trans domain-containing protein [Fusarium falciforme]